MALIKRLSKVLQNNYEDIIIETKQARRHVLAVYYKDSLADYFVTQDILKIRKTPLSRRFIYVLDDDYEGELFPFESKKLILKNSSIPIKNFNHKYLIDQVVNLHRSILFFKENIKTDYVFHDKTHNDPRGIRLAIIELIRKNKDLNIEGIVENFPYFNKNYSDVLNKISEMIDIKSINDLTNNQSIKKWCLENQKTYGEGDLYFYDTLNWVKNNLIEKQDDFFDYLYIKEDKLEDIRKLPHCIFITDKMGDVLQNLIKPKVYFDIKIKLKFREYSLAIMLW